MLKLSISSSPIITLICSTRFEGKTILRMALESGMSLLAKYLIKQYGADIIFDSNTPDYNPAQFMAMR